MLKILDRVAGFFPVVPLLLAEGVSYFFSIIFDFANAPLPSFELAETQSMLNELREISGRKGIVAFVKQLRLL